jgi:hypothetical protein
MLTTKPILHNATDYQSAWRGPIDNPIANQLIRCIPIGGQIITKIKQQNLLKESNSIKGNNSKDLSDTRLIRTEMIKNARYEVIGQLIKLFAYAVLFGAALSTGNIPAVIITGVLCVGAGLSLGAAIDNYKTQKENFNSIRDRW